MKVTYRGGGPRAGTFDFTPAFYRENCPRDDAPAALKAQCKALDDLATKSGYTTSINCIETPENAKCTAIISAAKAAQNVDIPKREACLRQGKAAYNKAQSDPSERRSNSCNYTLSAIGGSGRSTGVSCFREPAGRALTSISSVSTAAQPMFGSQRKTIRSASVSSLSHRSGQDGQSSVRITARNDFCAATAALQSPPGSFRVPSSLISRTRRQGGWPLLGVEPVDRELVDGDNNAVLV